MKKILITHTDLDGTGCAIVFKKKYPDISVEFRNYDTINERAKELYDEKEKYEKIFFADIIPTDREIGNKLVNDDKFVLIDHHITQDYLKGKRTYNTDFCGAYLSAIYLFGNIEENYDLENTSLSEIEKSFIYSIDAWDTWKLKSKFRENGERLNLLCFYFNLENFTEQYQNFDEIKGDNAIIAEVLERQEARYQKHKISQLQEDIDEDGNKYFKVFVGESHTGIGQIVDKIDMEDKKYVAFINLNTKQARLNSKGFDVSKIAQKYGGGGHEKSARCPIKDYKIIY